MWGRNRHSYSDTLNRPHLHDSDFLKSTMSIKRVGYAPCFSPLVRPAQTPRRAWPNNFFVGGALVDGAEVIRVGFRSNH